MPAGFSHVLLCKTLIEQMVIANEKEKKLLFFGSIFYDIMYVYGIGKDNGGNIGKVMHRKDTHALFMALKKHTHTETERLFAYGLITHYAFDITVHPYVYYCETLYSDRAVERKMREKVHYRLESDYDFFLHEKLGIKYDKKFKYYKSCILRKQDKKDIFEYMSKVLNDAFGIELSKTKYYFTLRKYWFFSQLLHDPRFIKQKIVRFFEKIFANRFFVSTLFHRKTPKRDYLNENKEEWHNIFDKSLTSDLSMFELFDEATLLSKRLIAEFDDGMLVNFDCNLNTGLPNKMVTSDK